MSKPVPPNRRIFQLIFTVPILALLFLASGSEKGRIISQFIEKQPVHQTYIAATQTTEQQFQRPIAPGCLSDRAALAGVPASSIPKFSMTITGADRDSVGQLRSFKAYDHEKGEYHTVIAELLSIGRYGMIYADTSFALNNESVQKLKDDFDNTIYPTSRNLFGEEANPGVDGDSLITILLYNIRDKNYYDSTATSIIAGYFNPIDSDPAFVNHPNSNKREMVYVDNQALNNNPNFTLGVLAHEYQHLIHRNLDKNEETWLNEGMSELAIVRNGYPRNSPSRFLNAPDSPLTDFQAQERGVAEYDKVYLFFLYLHEKYGDDLIRAIAGNPDNGILSVQDGLNTEAGGISFREVFGNWTVANYLDYDDGGEALYGYTTIDLPAIARTAVYSSLPVEQQSETLPRLTADYIEFLGGRELEINFNGENSNSNLSAKVVQFAGSGVVLSVTELPLDSQQDGSFAVEQFGTTVSKATLIVSQHSSTPLTASYEYSASGTGITVVSKKLTYVDGDPQWVFNIDPGNILVVSFDAQPGMGLDSVRYKFVSGGTAEFRVWRSSPNQSTNYSIPDSNLTQPVIMQVENVASSSNNFEPWHTVDYSKNNIQLDTPFSVGIILKEGAPDPKLVADDTSTTDPARNFIYTSNSTGQTQWFLLPYDLFVEAYVSTFVSDTTAPEISLGVVQNPVFTENIDLYVIGEKALNAASVKATVIEGTATQEYGFTTLSNDNLIFKSTDVRLNGPGQVTVIAEAKLARGAVVGKDTLVFTARIATKESATLLTSVDKTLSLNVFENSVSEPTWLTLIPYAQHGLNAARHIKSDAVIFAEHPVVIGPTNLRFENPVRLQWHAASAGRPVESLTIVRLMDDSWHEVKTWTAENGYLTAEINETGVYAVMSRDESALVQDTTLPLEYTLRQNFPNPFNPETRIAFSIPEKTAVRLNIYTITGQIITTLIDASLPAGSHEVTWNGRDNLGRELPSGLYFYELQTPGFRQVRKMTLIR